MIIISIDAVDRHGARAELLTFALDQGRESDDDDVNDGIMARGIDAGLGCE